MKATKIIGLTGPVASGKNEAAKILRRRGAYIIDVDKLAHALYEPQTPIWKEIVKTFGGRILNRGGKINRKKLGEIVFADKSKLKKLNEIVHPALKKMVIREIENRKQKIENRRPIIINAAALKEIGLVGYVDEVWVVLAKKETRLKRLMKKGLSRKEALKRINAQMPQKDYLKLADVVIRNDLNLRELNAQIQARFKL